MKIKPETTGQIVNDIMFVLVSLMGMAVGFVTVILILFLLTRYPQYLVIALPAMLGAIAYAVWRRYSE